MGATHVSALHPFDTALLSTPFVHFKIVNLGFLFVSERTPGLLSLAFIFHSCWR
jgi:hypothetical protein